MGINDRDVPQAADLLVDRLRIVGRVHQIVEMGDALSGQPCSFKTYVPFQKINDPLCGGHHYMPGWASELALGTRSL